MNHEKYWIFVLLLVFFIPLAIAQTPTDESLTIKILSDGKVKVNQILYPATYLSSINVETVSENISKILVTDKKNVLLRTDLEGNSLKVTSLGAAKVNVSYEADIISFENGIFNIKYQNTKESILILPPLSNLVGINSIPKDIDGKTFTMPPGSISLSYSIREVGFQSFDVMSGGIPHAVELMTGAKISDFKGDNHEISFLVEDKATVLAIIPITLFDDVDGVSLNGGNVDFKAYYENSTHSWVRIDPHENGLIKISSDTQEKIDTDTMPKSEELIIITKNNEEGGGCLIATATYGSEMSLQVQFLREIRDTKVMNTASGTVFTSGFNQLYYSFSPHIADLERQNPIFKEIVRIGITPLLSTLSILSFVDIESEQEMLGYGVMVILMNAGIYFVMPVLIFLGIKKVRTRRYHHSNQLVISNLGYKLRMNKSLFGIIALFVLLISIPTIMSEVYAEEDDLTPLEIALMMTEESAAAALDSADTVPPSAQALYDLGLINQQNALDNLLSDPEAANEFAIIAMALFEDTSVIIGTLQFDDSVVLGQLPSGFGSAVGGDGDGLGVGEIPSGQMKKLDAAAIFDEIAGLEEEAAYIGPIISANIGITGLSGYEGAINLAKIALANGDIPNALVKIAIAEELLNGLYDDLTAAAMGDSDVEAFVENTIDEIKSFLENGNKIGVKQNLINELQILLEILEGGDIELSLAATSEGGDGAKVLKEMNKEFERIQKSDNQDEEKGVREINRAAEQDLRETDPDAAHELLLMNKAAEKAQKAANKIEEKDTREFNRDAEKAARDMLKYTSSYSYFSYDDVWDVNPTDMEYNASVVAKISKELKEQLREQAKLDRQGLKDLPEKKSVCDKKPWLKKCGGDGAKPDRPDKQDKQVNPNKPDNGNGN